MLLPQMAIFAQGTRAHYFLEFDVLPDVSPSQAVSAFGRLRAPEASSGEGGSHVLAMRWLHDLDAFYRLPVHDQEQVIGRKKSDSEELAEGVRPATAHISRVQLDVAGKELELYRRSVPYGAQSEAGLYFVAFSSNPVRFGL